jgi:lysozyme family protein
VHLTPALAEEYVDLWRSCVIRASHIAEVDAIVDRLVAHKDRYAKAGRPHGVPWHVVGVVHMLEDGGNFAAPLHNADFLPRGRLQNGESPFTWEATASDALAFDGLGAWKNWSLPGTLFALERFNGFGYRPRKIHSPYLWSFSNQYSKGKFVGDEEFSPMAVSEQCGAAVLLRRMVGRGLVRIAEAGANGG